MTRALPRIEPVPAATAPRKRSTLRVVAAIGAVVLVLAAAGGLARLWVMQQYYVGVDADQVTIFQGVRGEVLGLPLHNVVEHTDITLDQLTESDRNMVSDGIIAPEGLGDANLLVDRLRGRMLAPCPVRRPRLPPLPSPTRLRSPRPRTPRRSPRRRPYRA
jgi:protein phosphatase